MKTPLSPCAPTSLSLQSLPKKRRTDLLESSSGSGTTGTGMKFIEQSSGTTTGKGMKEPYTCDTTTTTTGKGLEVIHGISTNRYTSEDIYTQYALQDALLGGAYGYTYNAHAYGFKYDKAKQHAEAQRYARANAAREFRFGYLYGSSPLDPEIYEEKFCIWSGGSCSWKDKSSGIMWVAVHGIDSICVVTSVNSVDMTRAIGDRKRLTEDELLYYFLRTVISDIEDIADPSKKLRERLVDLSFEKPPFCVVSVIPPTNEVVEDSGQEDSEYCSPKKAVEFLEKKMISGDSTSTTSKTIETAIGALQQLFLTQFKACEIQGCFLKFKEMKVEYLQDSELEKHLAVINAEASIN